MHYGENPLIIHIPGYYYDRLIGSINFLESLSKERDRKTKVLDKRTAPFRIPRQGHYFAAFM